MFYRQNYLPLQSRQVMARSVLSLNELSQSMDDYNTQVFFLACWGILLFCGTKNQIARINILQSRFIPLMLRETNRTNACHLWHLRSTWSRIQLSGTPTKGFRVGHESHLDVLRYYWLKSLQLGKDSQETLSSKEPISHCQRWIYQMDLNRIHTREVS